MGLKDFLFYKDNWAEIYCGDCRDILPMIEPVDLVLTDPPYGIGLDYGEGHSDDPEQHWIWFKSILDSLRTISPQVIFTHRQEALKHFIDWDHVCIWYKPMAFGYAINGWLAHWEPIFIYGGKVTYVATADRKPASPDHVSFTTERPNGHPAPKPLKLFSWLLSRFFGDLILDPFLGSGTTCVAAKNLNRKSIGIEIEPKYCEIAVKRLRQEVFNFGVK